MSTQRSYLLSLVCCFLWCAAGGGHVAPALAEQPPARPLKIGILDVRRVFEGYGKTASREGQIKQLSEAKRLERERIVSQLRHLRDEMLLMNEEARTERRRQFEEKLKGLADFDRQTERTLRSQQGEAIQSILDEIEQVVALYSKEQGFDLILIDRATIFSADSIDVTDEIIALLNRRYAQNR